jgi:rhodanese-related sulfurtransferase
MNRNRRMLLLMPLVLGLTACGANSQKPAAQGSTQEQLPMNMTVNELATRLDRGDDLLVLDVRSPEEFTQDGHVAGATLIPLPDLAMRIKEVPTNRPIACFCRSGNRSQVAADLLRKNGYANVTNVLGGIISWREANLPTEF